MPLVLAAVHQVPNGSPADTHGASPGGTGWQAKTIGEYGAAVNVPVWLGEGGPHNGGGHGPEANTFVASFTYLVRLFFVKYIYIYYIYIFQWFLYEISLPPNPFIQLTALPPSLSTLLSINRVAMSYFFPFLFPFPFLPFDRICSARSLKLGTQFLHGRRWLVATTSCYGAQAHNCSQGKPAISNHGLTIGLRCCGVA